MPVGRDVPKVVVRKVRHGVDYLFPALSWLGGPVRLGNSPRLEGSERGPRPVKVERRGQKHQGARRDCGPLKIADL